MRTGARPHTDGKESRGARVGDALMEWHLQVLDKSVVTTFVKSFFNYQEGVRHG